MEMYDELLDQAGTPRPHAEKYLEWLRAMPSQAMRARELEAEVLFKRLGITFAVGGEGDEAAVERLIPTDVVPRIIPAEDWKFLERGLRQRVQALNRFIDDIYHDARIVREGKIPADMVFGNSQYQVAMRGCRPPLGIWVQIAGIDIVRHADGNYYVLEDNLRVPSGVSYMLQNRKMMRRLFPEVCRSHRIAPVEEYPLQLLQTLKECAPCEHPTVAVLTPGPHNSAYFEHAYLSQQMGVELVEGRDLRVDRGKLFMSTTSGLQQVDVLYRRIDDAFLDPLVFRSDSMLGVPGLVAAVRSGNLGLANSMGTGVADDKSIYPYVPDMIRFYMGEEPLLRNVQTWRLRNADERSHVLENLEKLVVKEVHGAGGYGMLVGPASTAAEREEFKRRIEANPANYIAQPTLSLSTCPIWLDEDLSPRHVDLRPFVLSGRQVRIVPGGLTRVALRQGSLVVNSSQGGGTKDTWVLEEEKC